MADEEILSKKPKTSFFQKILILLLFIILNIVLGAFIVLMDYIGAINLRKRLPDSLKKYPIVQEYIKKVEIMHMTEEERLKFWIEEQNDLFIKQQQDLKEKEYELEEKMKKLVDLEKEMGSKQKEIESAENKLNDIEKKIEDLEGKKETIDEGIKTEQLDDLEKREKLRRLATIYEKMDPAVAGETFNEMDEDLAIDILMMMKESKAAEVMNNINAIKVKDLAEKLKTKGAWKNSAQ